MRHPDEIKKFVKKNGTYMLKKTTSSSKSSKNESLDDSFSTSRGGQDDVNPEDSGVDEPKPGEAAGSVGTSSKLKSSGINGGGTRQKKKTTASKATAEIKYNDDDDNIDNECNDG